MQGLRKILSRDWWIGPNPAIPGAVRRKLIKRLLAKESKVARACGLPGGVECPVCGYEGALFHPVRGRYDVLRLNSECPQCRARERHRLMKLVLDDLDVQSWEGPLLHFSPEAGLGEIFKGVARIEYRTADFGMAGVDYEVDIQDLPFEDDQWAYIICSHVLEHVPDDGKALSEMRRVLRPDGLLVLCVPVVEGLAETVEFGEPHPWISRHVRDYGADFRHKVNEYFEVEDRGAENRPAAEVVRHVLKLNAPDHDMLLVCRLKG